MQIKKPVIWILLYLALWSYPAFGEVVEVLESTNRYTLLEVNFTDVEIDSGIPCMGALLAIPPLSGVDVEILQSEYSTVSRYKFLTGSDEATRKDYFYPKKVVKVGRPAIFRDYRVVPVNFYPVSYDSSQKVFSIYREVKVKINYVGKDGINPKTKPPRLSPAFQDLYRQTIINYDYSPPPKKLNLRGEGARYLIITHDDFYDAVLPLADWKNKKGMKTILVKLSDIGSSAYQIKNYIQNAYANWEIPPEYILLVGDTEFLPNSNWTDNYYATLEGDDYLADVFVGRLSVDNVSQCSTLVAKCLGYEKSPYLDDPEWFRRAVLIVRDDYDPPDDSIYYSDTWFAYDRLDDLGFTEIDTLFRKNGANKNDVVAAVNDGCVFVSYRGQGVSNWWGPFDVDPNNTNNGFKLPIIISGTCGTGDFNGDSYICEPWIRAGTAQNPKGAVGFFGASTICSHCAYLRSPVVKGFFQGVHSLKNLTFGMAAESGRLNLYRQFDDQEEYEGWNVLGDPELNIWLSTPETLEVTHSPTVPIGTSDFQVTVAHQGSPVSNALVCLLMDTTVYEYDYTGIDGLVTFSIDVQNLDTLWITVSGASNFLPYEGYAVAISSGPYLTYQGRIVSDSSGNNDDLVNPGETIEMWITLSNTGIDTSFGVWASLRTQDSLITLVDSVSAYGDIPPDSSAISEEPYTFSVSPDLQNGQFLLFTLYIEDSESNSWSTTMPAIPIDAAELVYQECNIYDSLPGGNDDQDLDAGESAGLIVTLQNLGLEGLTGVEVVLHTEDPWIHLNDSVAIIDQIPPLMSVDNSSHPYSLSTSPVTPHEHIAQFFLFVMGDGGLYTYSDTLYFSLTIGELLQSDPTGPDEYGYWAYSNSDTSSTHQPTYDWIEIAPPGPGSVIDEITDEDAATVTIPLPFSFRYYGINYTYISVCSNGFLAMGSTSYRWGDNSPIPSSNGPPSMIAPFWDDLDPSLAGDIYQYYDSENHRWIVEFDGVAHYGASSQRETFEVILYDPSYRPTPTGDGEILFQYQAVANSESNTVGIENDDQTTGIQYLYNNSLDPTASPLTGGTAIKFTTYEPEGTEAPWIWLLDYSIYDPAGNNNGAPDPGETVDMVVQFSNEGNSNANQTQVILSTSDSDITLLDSVASFGDIPPSGISDNSSDPYSFVVSPTPEDSIAIFRLHITANQGDYQVIYVTTLYLGSAPINQFIRGDANSDETVSTPDAVYILRYKFIPGSPPPSCMDAADADDNGNIDMPDAIYILKYKFIPGASPPPPPFPNCGGDPTLDELGCQSHPCMGGATGTRKIHQPVFRGNSGNRRCP